MNALKFSLEVYNGPLDLLLSLIQKHKIDIYDIPIAEITGQYMDELGKMREMDMEMTGEFLVMAAQLVLMKSRALLPRKQEAGEDEMTAEELRDRLIEYKRIKEVAGILAQHQFSTLANYFKRPEKIERAVIQNVSMEPSKLYEAFLRVLERIDIALPPSGESFRNIVSIEKIPLSDKIREVLALVRKKKGASFESLIANADTRGEAITIFLAVLHVVSRGHVRIRQTGGEILLLSA